MILEENTIIYKGIIDKDRNPFSTPSWCKEHHAGNPEGSGKDMQQTAIDNFQKVIDKGSRIVDIKEPHYETYATFQAIRWGYAVKQGNRIVPTEKWCDISPKRGFNVSYAKSNPELQTQSISTNNNIKKTKSAGIYVNSFSNLTQSELINSLKSFDLNTTISNYLNQDNLKSKSVLHILKNYTFGNSIARAFHHESPTNQYQSWASQININEVIGRLSKISNQNEYDIFLFEIAESLVKSWDDKNEIGGKSKMNIGISLKIINLLLKHLVFVHFENNSNLIKYLHVPWDKFTLQPLHKIWNGYPKINSSSSQGFIKNLEQYFELHNFITNIVSQASVDRITYEFWAWDKHH